jgi:hypothetical protein
MIIFKKAAPELRRSITHSVTEGQANSADGIGEDAVIAGGVEEFQREAREGGRGATGDQKRASAEKKGTVLDGPFSF